MTGKYVAVLCGGNSRERDVSLRSGKAVFDALNNSGFDAVLIDLKTLNEAEQLIGFDGAFIAMHGDWGENGQIRQNLRLCTSPTLVQAQKPALSP